MPLPKTQTDSTVFKTLLKEQGIYQALLFLNSKSIHRFTALYTLEGSSLRNVCIVDKENGEVRQTGAINISDSYCLYVRNSGKTFVTPDSLNDERVQGHPKQAAIQSYCGMPLVGATTMLGTLCHFDFAPQRYTEEEIFLLEQVTPSLVSWLENNFLPQQLPANPMNAASE